jgi:oleandomycin transport system permease protein
MSTPNTVMDITVSDYPDSGKPLAPEPLAERVGPVEGLRQTFSLAWRTLVQIRHNPLELIDFSVQPVMFLLMFTYVFGGALGGSPKTYLLFALPGIIVQNSLFTTLNTATGLSTDLKEGFFDRLRSLPIARFAPLAGRILADLAKQTWAIAVLVQIFGFVVLFPLTFTSDAFVRTATMPGWLQAWSKANPVSLISDAVRGLTVSGPAGRPVVESLLYTAAFTIVFAPLAVQAFKRRV